jgi:outer membrane autotransporter protein
MRSGLLQTTYVLGILLLSTTAYAGSGTINRNLSYVSQFGSAGTGDGQFDYTTQAVIDSKNNLLVMDSNNGRVQVFDRNGSYIRQFGTNGNGPGQLQTGYTITLDRTTNNIIVGDGRLSIFDSDYNFISNEAESTFSALNGAEFNAAGELYTTEYYGNQIKVFDTDFNIIRTIGNAGSGPREFNGMNYISFAADGRYYIAESGNNRVQIFDSNDQFAGYLGTFDPGAAPCGVYVDDFGNVYVTTYNGGEVHIYDKDGALITKYGTSGSGPGQFQGAESILVADDGRIYISDSLNNRVQILQIVSDETFTSAPTGAGDEIASTPMSSLRLQGASPITFDHDFIGYNDVRITGDWTLNGNSSFTTEFQVVGSSNVFVNGMITAPDISNYALMGGSGTLVGNVFNDGVISPGTNSIGTLTITGNYTADPTSEYTVDVNDTGQSDHINISGNANLANSILNINAADGTYAAITDYTILTAGGTLTGGFGTTNQINTNLAFLVPTLSYDGHNAILSLANPNATGQVDFIPYAGDGNQMAAATALNQLSTSNFNGDTQLDTTVQGLNTQEAARFLKQNTPDTVATLANSQMQSLNQIQSPLWQRMSMLQTTPPIQSYGNQTSSSAESFALLSPASGVEQLSKDFWMEAIAGVINQDSQGSNSGYRSVMNGGRAGMDHQLENGLTIGISGAYIQTRTRFDLSNNNAESHYGHVDFYAQKQVSQVLVEGFVGAGAGKVETSRFISAGGLNRTAEGDAMAYDVIAALKLSHEMPATETVSLIPSMTTTASWQRQNGFTEKGAGALNMKVDSIDVTPVTVKPMLTVQKRYSTSKHGMNVVTSLGAGATWQANERQSSVTAGFNNVPQFTVQGAKQKPFSANIVANFTLEPAQGSKYIPSASLTASSQMNSISNNHTGAVHLTWKW